MCINKRWIKNPVTGVRVLVSCGHCEACQQEKANKRTTRIRLQTSIDVPLGYQTMFVTLTYDNNHIPYINKRDYDKFINGKCSFLPVYRLGFRYFNGNVKRPLRCPVLLDSWDVCEYQVQNTKLELKRNFVTDWLFNCPNTSLPALRYVHWYDGKKYYSYDSQRIGVLRYKDIQDFMKRLRITLKRKYNADYKLKFFCVGEYGPDSYRPHYHLLLHFPKGHFAELQAAVCSCWKFDSINEFRFMQQQIKLAKDAAAYVSSYVNKSVDFPDFFKAFRPFRQMHVYSQGYGMASKYCKLDYLEKCVDSSTFYYSKTIQVGSVKSSVQLPLPSYVVNRYFPKFKGYSRFTNSEILLNISEPQRFYEYSKTIGYENDDIHKIQVSLRNHYLKWCDLKRLSVNDYSLSDYAKSYVNTWTAYYSFLHKLGWSDCLCESDLPYHFVNWFQMKNHVGEISEKIGFLSEFYGNYERDPNKFPANIAKDNELRTKYFYYDKKKKIKNEVLSTTSFV